MTVLFQSQGMSIFYFVACKVVVDYSANNLSTITFYCFHVVLGVVYVTSINLY